MAAPWERTLFHFADHVHDPSGEPRENYELLGRRPLGAAHATVDLSLWAPLAQQRWESYLASAGALDAGGEATRALEAARAARARCSVA